MNPIEVQISGTQGIVPCTYKTVVLKPNIINNKNILVQDMVNQTDTKYVIKHDYIITDGFNIGNVDVLNTNISQCINPVYTSALSAYNEAHDAWIDADNAYTNNPNETTLATKNAAYAAYTAAQTSLNDTPQYYYYAAKAINIKKNQHITIPEGCVLLNSILNGILGYNIAPNDTIVYIGSTTPGTYGYNIQYAIQVPAHCLIEFDGGSISDGVIVGNNTILIYNQELDDVMKNVVKEGTFVYNNTLSADDEDLTEKGNILQFKDRPNTDGMGRIILRKNKPFASQLTQTNTIYEIRYDFDLNNQSVTIPSNCVLEFDGGSITGAYTLTGNNTGIQAGLVKIFNTDVTLDGTWNISEIYPEWFYNGSGSWNNALQKAIDLSSISGVILLTQDSYYIEAVENATLIVAKNNAVVVSYKRSRLYTNTSVSYRAIIGDTSAIGKFTIKGVWFDQRGETHTSAFENTCLKFESIEYVHIEGCYFNSLSSATIIVNNPFTCKYCCVKNNHIQFFKGISDYYDCSCINLRAAFITVEGNVILGSPGNRFVGGIEVHGFNTIATNNTIKYGDIGFYVCNDIPIDAPFYSDDYIEDGQILLANNKFDRITIAFVLWAEKALQEGRTYPPLRNVNIIDNIGENVSKVVDFADSREPSQDHPVGYWKHNDLNGLLVQGNNFSSTQKSIVSTTSQGDFANWAAIYINSGMTVTNVVIKGNTFTDFAKLMIFNRDFLLTTKKQELVFVDNVCNNCKNYVISEEPQDVNINKFYPAITAGYGDLAFINNVFNFSKERIVYPIIYTDLLSGGTAKAKISYSGNKFSGNVKTIPNKRYLIENTDMYLKSINATPNETLDLNEYAINTDKTIVKCTQKGTKRNGTTFPATKITSLGKYNGWYISPQSDSDNLDFVKVGDFLNITGFTDSNTSFLGVQSVWAICNGYIFTEFVDNGGTQRNVGTEINIPSIAFRAYVVQ